MQSNQFSVFGLFLAFFLASTSVFAQENESTERTRNKREFRRHSNQHPHQDEQYHGVLGGPWRVEAGLNATNILAKVVRKSLDSANLNPYLLQFRVSKGQVGIHAAIGGAYDDRFDALEGFADSKTNIQKELQLRAGPDFRTTLGRHFTATLGADYVIDYHLLQQITDSGYDVLDVIDQQSLHGAGLSLGLTYWPTRRIGITTEANLQWLTGYRDQGRRFRNFPELDDQLSYQKIGTLRKSVLGGVFLVYRI